MRRAWLERGHGGARPKRGQGEVGPKEGKLGRDGLRRRARGRGVGLGKGKGQRGERAWEGRGPRSGNRYGEDGRSGKEAARERVGI